MLGAAKSSFVSEGVSMKFTIVAGAMASAFLSVSPIAAYATTLSDGDFASLGTPLVYTASGETVGYQNPCTSCGNPDFGLQASFSDTTTVPSTASAVGFVDTGLSYNPGSSGAIASISATYQRMLTYSTSLAAPTYFFRLAIDQGGVYYAANINQGSMDPGNVWHTFSASGLTASSFTQFDFTTGNFLNSPPDFSSSAASMAFGVLVLGGLSGENQSVIADFDNFNITITQTPLPAALPLFATGLAGLGLLGWRRKRKVAA